MKKIDNNKYITIFKVNSKFVRIEFTKDVEPLIKEWKEKHNAVVNTYKTFAVDDNKEIADLKKHFDTEWVTDSTFEECCSYVGNMKAFNHMLSLRELEDMGVEW